MTDNFGHTRSRLCSTAGGFEPGLASIIIPCFNMESLVADAIDSALGQTYENVEVIVVDDGSTDGSLQAIRAYGSRVTVKAGPNAGACSARNDGIELSRGEYIQFLDADDTLKPDAVERRIAAFTAATGCVFGDRLHKRPDDSPVRWHTPPHSERIWEQVGMLRYVLFCGIAVFEPLYRRQWVCAVGGFDEALPRYQELDFHTRLVLEGCKFDFTPGIIGTQLHHAEDVRISNVPWWESNPDLLIKVWRHVLSVIEQRDPSLIDRPLKDDIARHLVSVAANLVRHGAAPVARLYQAEILRLQPGYRPSGAAGVVTATLGLWNTIVIGAWVIRARIKLGNLAGR
jgi:hypothetical protein